MSVLADTGVGSVALVGTVLASAVAVLTSIGTIIANRASKRRAEAEADAAVTSSDVNKDRLSLDGLVAYADRLEKENERLRTDNEELRHEVYELRDLRELIEQLRNEPSDRQA